MNQKPRRHKEHKYQICSHCGKAYPKDSEQCPFCQYKPSTVEKVGDKLAYVRIALIAAIIAIGFVFKCVHDRHQLQKQEKVEATEQQEATEQAAK